MTQRDELVHISSHDGPATVAALMDLARSRKVTVKRVSVQSTTLDDVFLHYTGTRIAGCGDTARAMTSAIFIDSRVSWIGVNGGTAMATAMRNIGNATSIAP